MPTFPCHGADARREGGRAGWSSSSGSAHVDINNTKGEVPRSAAPGLLLQLPEALVTTKQAGGSQELCRLIGMILKKTPILSCFPSLGAAGKRNEEEDLLFPSCRGGEVGRHSPAQGQAALDYAASHHRIPPLQPQPSALTGARQGGSSLLCQFFFVIFCFLLVFLLLSLFLFFFLFFIFLFLAAPGHLLLLQNKGHKINQALSAEADTWQHLGQPKQLL